MSLQPSWVFSALHLGHRRSFISRWRNAAGVFTRFSHTGLRASGSTHLTRPRALCSPPNRCLRVDCGQVSARASRSICPGLSAPRRPLLPVRPEACPPATIPGRGVGVHCLRPPRTVPTSRHHCVRGRLRPRLFGGRGDTRGLKLQVRKSLHPGGGSGCTFTPPGCTFTWETASPGRRERPSQLPWPCWLRLLVCPGTAALLQS